MPYKKLHINLDRSVVKMVKYQASILLYFNIIRGLILHLKDLTLG